MNLIQNGAFYIVQLQVIHLINLQYYNVLLKRGPSATAEPLVFWKMTKVIVLKNQKSAQRGHLESNKKNDNHKQTTSYNYMA